MAQYFKDAYKMVFKDPNQPLFVTKSGGENIYLPPEYCILDGVSDAIKKSREMRDALSANRLNPQQKMKRIHQMAVELS